MHLRISHLRRGELLAGLWSVVLVVLMFVIPWFGSGNGWDSLPVLRWLLLVTAASGLLLAIFQQTRRAPALPVVTAVIVTPLALLSAILLIIRLPTSAATPQVGAFLGLVAVAGIGVGGFYSMRDEDGWQPGPDHPVERVSLPSGGPR